MHYFASRSIKLQRRLLALSLLVFLVPTACGSGGDSGDGGEGGFESSGESRGAIESLFLSSNESFGGFLDGLELAMTYDPITRSFQGTIKNELSSGVCDLRIEVIQMSNGITIETLGPATVVGLNPRSSQTFNIPVRNNSFDGWFARVESFTCASTGEGHGGEGGGEGNESGSEGGNESGGEEGGEGGGDSGESSPDLSPTVTFTGTLNNLDFTFSFDPIRGAFVGQVMNMTDQPVCNSRVEVHMASGGQVLELGPTVGIDLLPGESTHIVISPAGTPFSAWTLHPESSPCP